MKFSFSFIASLLIAFSSLAQEELSPLSSNPVLLKKNESQKQMRYQGLDIQFLIDTLELPFLDDFSIGRQHRYHNSANLSFLDTTYAKYRVNGEAFDSVMVMFDTTYSYYYSSVTQTVDTIANSPWRIQQFDPDSALPWQVGEFWPAYSFYFSNGSPIDTGYYSEDTIIYNELEPIYIAYDSTSLWVDNHAFVNNTFHVSAPTVGVATFDGIDSLGHAYNIDNQNAYDIADYLTSKPINLEGKSNVVFSFYYQQQGLGNRPEEKDSLVLEFFIPDSARWRHEWAVQGDTALTDVAGEDSVPPFKYVEISLSGDELKKGFKFRFKNYATLSGSLDQWSIDYVYLNANRTLGDSATIDLGFKSIDRGVLKTYTSMPWNQYQVDPSKYMNERILFKTTNRSKTDLSGQNTYQVIDLDDNSVVHASTVSAGLFPNFTPQTVEKDSLTIPFVFPAEAVQEKKFEIRYATRSNTIASQEQNTYNDTVMHIQEFSSYFSYDDGTPERAYSVVGAGSKLAYGFELEEADTLKSVLIHFTEMFAIPDNSIRLMVWKDNNGIPGDTLYKGYVRDTFFVADTMPVRFMRFYVDREVVLEAGKFFVGFEQQFAEKLYVGFDMNTRSQSKIFYNVSGSWINTSFEGSLLIRPDFGKANLGQIYSTSIDEMVESEASIYPNPAGQQFCIDGATNSDLTITSITGQVVLQEFSISQQHVVDVSGMPNGVYLVHLRNKQGETSTEKIIVNR